MTVRPRSRVLVAYSSHGAHVPTTSEYLNAYASFLEADVDYLHVANELGAEVDIEATLSDYDVVINNYCARHCFDWYVGRVFIDALKKFSGLKVLVVQDEYDRTNFLKERIRDISFDVVLTSVPQKSLDYIYPRRDFPNTRFETVLTGYVPESLIERTRELRPLTNRPIIVGYRGRDIGGRYGRLAFEKFEIGRRMREFCLARGVAHDIEMSEAARIYGFAWFNFIGSCRSMLGSESGSNVFDFDGALEEQFRGMESATGVTPSYAEFAPYIGDCDVKISMAQISPRVFECAIMRTPMILFRGYYSGVVTEEEHYIPLDKDFSNVDQVFDRLRDTESLEALADRSHRHLVTSGKFGYRAYMKRLQAIIDEELERVASEPTKNILRISPREEVPSMLIERPSRRPKSRDPIDKRQLIIIRNEIFRLTNNLSETMQQYVSLCDFLTQDTKFASKVPTSSGGAARTLLREIKQFREFLLAFAVEGQNWCAKEDLSKPAVLLDVYKRRLEQLYVGYDRIYATHNALCAKRDEILLAKIAARLRLLARRLIPEHLR